MHLRCRLGAPVHDAEGTAALVLGVMCLNNQPEHERRARKERTLGAFCDPVPEARGVTASQDFHEAALKEVPLVIGVDSGDSVVQVHGVAVAGQVISRRRLWRGEGLGVFGRCQRTIVAIVPARRRLIGRARSVRCGTSDA